MGEAWGNGEWAKMGELLLDFTAEKDIGRVWLPETTPYPAPVAPYCGNTSCQVKSRSFSARMEGGVEGQKLGLGLTHAGKQRASLRTRYHVIHSARADIAAQPLCGQAAVARGSIPASQLLLLQPMLGLLLGQESQQTGLVTDEPSHTPALPKHALSAAQDARGPAPTSLCGQ